MTPSWLTDTVTSDLDRALHYTLLWGLEGVELRTVGRAADRVPFVNEEKLHRRLAEHEVPPVAIVPGVFEGDVAGRVAWMNEVVAFQEVARFCTRIGCPCVVVSGFTGGAVADARAVDALRRLGDVAGRSSLTVAVLNEGDGTHATGRALAALLEAVDHPQVQAAWHPSEALRAGEDPAAGLDALAGRVALVRCGDVRRVGEAWEAAPLGEGAVGWAAQLQRLHAAGFEGPLSLEVHGEPRPKRGLHDATALIQLIRQARRGG